MSKYGLSLSGNLSFKRTMHPYSFYKDFLVKEKKESGDIHMLNKLERDVLEKTKEYLLENCLKKYDIPFEMIEKNLSRIKKVEYVKGLTSPVTGKKKEAHLVCVDSNDKEGHALSKVVVDEKYLAPERENELKEILVHEFIHQACNKYFYDAKTKKEISYGNGIGCKTINEVVVQKIALDVLDSASMKYKNITSSIVGKLTHDVLDKNKIPYIKKEENIEINVPLFKEAVFFKRGIGYNNISMFAEPIMAAYEKEVLLEMFTDTNNDFSCGDQERTKTLDCIEAQIENLINMEEKELSINKNIDQNKSMPSFMVLMENELQRTKGEQVSICLSVYSFLADLAKEKTKDMSFSDYLEFSSKFDKESFFFIAPEEEIILASRLACNQIEIEKFVENATKKDCEESGLMTRRLEVSQSLVFIDVLKEIYKQQKEKGELGVSIQKEDFDNPKKTIVKNKKTILIKIEVGDKVFAASAKNIGNFYVQEQFPLEISSDTPFSDISL